MIDYLTYYYELGTEPFRSLSALSDREAIQIMASLYTDTPFGARFKDPVQYMRDRRQTERWVREAFIAKGGQPRDAYPIPMVLGESKWMVKIAPDPAVHGEIRIPLALFSETDLSFTYPDSMLSFWLDKEKPAAVYLPDYHGKIFTLPEILAIVEMHGLPEEEWETNLPDNLAPYIEAQIWNHQPLEAYKRQHENAG